MEFFAKYLARFRDQKDPVTKLTTISFALIFVTAIVMGQMFNFFLSSQIQHHNAEAIAPLISSYLHENLLESDFEDHSDAIKEKISRKVSEMKNHFNLLSIKIMTPSGDILFSDSPKTAKMKSGGRLKKALKGEIVHNFVDAPNGDEKIPDKKLFCVTIPVIFPNSTKIYAVIEIFKNPFTISKSIYISWLVIWLFAILGGIFIYLIFSRVVKRTYQQNQILQYELMEYSRELESNIQVITDVQNVTILGLSKLAEFRDKETGLHLERMSLYSKLLAEELSKWDKFKFYITKDYVNSIYTSAVLHDIGKVGIPDRVLLKPGKLDDEEWEIMKRHTVIGGDAIAAADKKLGFESFLTIGKEVAYYHHERIDGKGYPYGLKDEDIPISARIVAIADVFDALMSVRVYKPAYNIDTTKKILLEEKGGHFDPDVVDAFLKIEASFLEIADKFKE